MPNTQIQSNKINTNIKSITPNTRAGGFKASFDPSGISIGMPIGLLLSLTYAWVPTGASMIGDKPNSNIINK